jgi:hypothetical protein
LWYAPTNCVSIGDYPQYINTGVVVGDAEFSYDTQIPSIGCQPQEDSVLIFRNIACNRYFMIRLDHFLGKDGCAADGNDRSKLFYDKTTPATAEGVCTPGVISGTFVGQAGEADISCVVKNTWYSMRVRACGATILARAWQTGTTEPGAWQLSTTDSALVTYPTGNFGFQANQGQTAFRNMTVSSIGTQSVTVTDNVNACMSGVAVVGASAGTYTVSGNNLTWNVGTMGPCNPPKTMTLRSDGDTVVHPILGHEFAVPIRGCRLGAGLDHGGGVHPLTRPSDLALITGRRIGVTISVCNRSGAAHGELVSISD